MNECCKCATLEYCLRAYDKNYKIECKFKKQLDSISNSTAIVHPPVYNKRLTFG